MMTAEQRGMMDPLPLIQRCRDVLSVLGASPLPPVDSAAEERRRRAAIAAAVVAGASAIPDQRNVRAFEGWVAGQMRSLEDRCFAIVSAMPQGQRVAELVRSVLWRELKWGAWKEQQCPPLSREALAVLPQEVVVSEDASASATVNWMLERCLSNFRRSFQRCAAGRRPCLTPFLHMPATSQILSTRRTLPT